MRIFLTGMPGSGKSYWMKQLAGLLQYQAIDMDHFITVQSGATISGLFAVSETHFREQERMALETIIEHYPDRIVVATGGGAPCYRDNMQLMKTAGCVLYLETSMETLLAHIEQSPNQRPLLSNGSAKKRADQLSELYRQRKEIYGQAQVKIHADTATLSTFADAIAQYLSDQNLS